MRQHPTVAIKNLATGGGNKANIDTLTLLKGVGEKRAKAIVAYRKLHGKFKSVNDLQKVSGIGEQTLVLNKGRIKL